MWFNPEPCGSIQQAGDKYKKFSEFVESSEKTVATRATALRIHVWLCVLVVASCAAKKNLYNGPHERG